MKNNKLNLISAVIFLFLFSFLIACEESDSTREINRPTIHDPSEFVDGPVSIPADNVPINPGGSSGSSGTSIGSGSGGGGGTAGDDGGGGGMAGQTPPAEGTGIIRGMVVSSGSALLNGVNVRAVNVDDINTQVSSFSGIDCGLVLSNGMYCIQNVPEGTYRVLIERLDGSPAAFDNDRYSAFISDNATNLIFPDEYWNGAGESSSDDPMDFETVVVTDGMTVYGIDFTTNN